MDKQKIKRVNIYDMDGTIVCSLHRYRTVIDERGERIDLDYWRENEHLAFRDGLLPLAKQYQRDLLDPECYVVIATARVLNKPDWLFMEHTLGLPDYVVSRPHGETAKGSKLKIQGLTVVIETFKHLPRDSFTFFEDNVDYLKAVCDHFNIRGVYVPSKQGH
jgi:hypothetical protein